MIRQQGIALITALLIVALVTIIAGSMTQRLHLDLRRAQNQQLLEQGFQYARGVEALARIALQQDARDSAGNDHYGEAWAQSLPLLPIDGGLLTGSMIDLDGRFNLNNLIIDDLRQPEQVAIFQRLLRLLELDPSLTDAVVDWLDSDSLPTPAGAEDNHYGRITPAYRAANQRFHHWSELRLVAGFDRRVVERLQPYVVALPVNDQPTPININTASQLMLRALDPGIAEQSAEVLWQDGRAQWTSVSEFVRHPLLVGRISVGLSRAISTDSRHFLVHATVQLDDRLQQFHSVLEETGGWQVTWRSRSPY